MLIKNFAKELIKQDGIWYSEKTSRISYPESGNQDCFELEENSFWFKHRNNCIIQCVKKYCPNEIFFDIGGGNGFVTKALENNNIETVLVEPGAQGCINAKSRGLQNIICSTIENSTFTVNTIPAIGLFDVVVILKMILYF